MTSYSESELVAILQKASDAYYNGKEEGLLTDERYDELRDELETRFPQNPYLKQIGAPVEKGAVRLPYKMASLTKIKPGTGAVESFRKSSAIPAWVLTDKLDGISVLWDTGKRKLYLRGDGLMGVDVSAFAPYINGLTPRSLSKKSWVIRGELLLRKDTPVEGLLPRSWVNGQLHQKTPIPEQLGKIRFVAYELLVPSLLFRWDQLQTLAEEGFEVPWTCVVTSLTDELLSSVLQKRRTESPYPIDGIVVGENRIPAKQEAGDAVENPKDMRAFKMPLEDQKATTSVVDVLWSASHQGYWIPRIQIQPVTIGGSRIAFLTGHNARTIVANQIGKGAVIVVRKSGDVIPTLERVITPCPTEVYLPNGDWDGDAATASHYKVKQGATLTEVKAKKLEHFAKVLEIPHLGPGLVAKLVAEGKDTPNALLTISKEDLETCIGKGMAAKVYPEIQAKQGSCTELDLMLASSVMPRGVGDTKLKALFALQPDPRKWSTIQTCEGWTPKALVQFHSVYPTYEQWRKEELPCVPYPRLGESTPLQPVPTKGCLCLTGFRDAVLQKKLEDKGYTISNSVTKKTTALLVKSLEESSEKMEKAKALGIRILTREQAEAEYL